MDEALCECASALHPSLLLLLLRLSLLFSLFCFFLLPLPKLSSSSASLFTQLGSLFSKACFLACFVCEISFCLLSINLFLSFYFICLRCRLGFLCTCPFELSLLLRLLSFLLVFLVLSLFLPLWMCVLLFLFSCLYPYFSYLCIYIAAQASCMHAAGASSASFSCSGGLVCCVFFPTWAG